MSDPDLRRDVAALRDELVAAAQSLDPIPAFPGAAFAYGIEIVPSEGEDPELGCVILGNDGALYELQIGIDDTKASPAVVDASIERHEELVPLDVPDEVYVRYARAALEEVARRRAE